MPSISLSSNKLPPSKKPVSEVRKHQQMLRRVARRYPWVASDVAVYDEVVKLWHEDHNVQLFSVDGPRELLRESIKNEWGNISRPRKRGVHLPWWVYIYLRERIMTSNIEKALATLPHDATVLVFLQKFHWLNAQFLLTKPSNKQIYQYYFAAFDTPQRSLEKRIISLNNAILLRYWKKYSDLATV